MEKTPAKKKRVRVVVYLDPANHRKLKREHGETDRAGSAIVEEALEAYWDAKSRHPAELAHSV